MNAPTPALVTDATAWKGADMARDPGWIVTLNERQLDELKSAADACIGRGLREIDVKPADFAMTTMAAELKTWAHELAHGRGFLLVRGLTKAWSDAQIRTAFWGMGLYLGSPISQNSYGDMLGEVFDEGVKMGSGKVRGYRTNQHLYFHTDRCDIVGLLCQRPAKSGGLSSIVSSTRVYNEIAQAHPEYLGPLLNGYIHLNVEEGGDLSTYRVPVFSGQDGVLSARILRNSVEAAIKMGRAQYTELETAALASLDACANRADLRLDMMLERGDIQLINNYTIMHARTEFEDFEEPHLRRRMVRLWLTAHGERRKVNAGVFRDYHGVHQNLQRQ